MIEIPSIDTRAYATVENAYSGILDEMRSEEYSDAERALIGDVKFYYGRFLEPRTREYALDNATMNVGRAIRYLDVSRPGVRILDVGCGLGMQSLIFARHGATVVGVDLDPRCVALAEKRRLFFERAWGMKLQATFVAADFHEFARRWQPGDFDAAFSMSAFAYIAPLDETLRLLSRVLRPRARVYLWDDNPDFLFRNVLQRERSGLPRPGRVRRTLEAHGFDVDVYMGGGGIPRMFWRGPRTNALMKRVNEVLRRSIRLSFNYVIAAHRESGT